MAYEKKHWKVFLAKAGDTSEGIPLNKDFTNYKSLFTLPVSQPDKRTLKLSVKDTIAQLIGFAKFTDILGKKYDFTEIKKLLKDDTAILVGALLLKLNLILHDSNLWVDLVDPNNRLESSDDETMEETIMKRLNRSLPLLALHTVRGCIPNVESYATHGNKFITCAIRPIKAGEELILNVKSESVWYKGSTSERQLSYSKMYRCPCNCQACTGNWSEVVSNTYEFMMRAIKEMESPETTKIANDIVSIVTHWEANCLKSNFPDFEVVSKAMNLVSVVWEHEKLPMPSPTIHKSVILLIEIMGIFYDPSEIYAKLPQLRPSLIDVKSKAELRLSKKL
ncbi:hypothetical protein QAD02_011338 [Eretmocerus hayati]|uniref:Uncharacterized protein n=1 Tax=Eretmocerus hayati TaxID=131215 RepID=A0ACC2NZB5_9HYME|nr:hypothetical protein QAD02_011338 [Eretmocerus hayati]